MISCRLAKDANTVGLWHFTEGSGTTVKDYSGNGYNGAINGGAIYVNNTPLGSGLTFDGVDDRVVVGNISAFNFAYNSNFTIEAIVYLNPSNNNRNIVSKETADGLIYYTGWSLSVRRDDHPTDPRKILFSYINSTNTNNYYQILSNTALLNNTWYYIAAVFVNGNSSIYINGNKDTVTTLKNTLTSTPTNNYNLVLGGRHESTANLEYYNGKIACIRISNIARSAAEIKHNWLRMPQVLVA